MTTSTPAEPRGQQVIEAVRTAIISGRFEPGDRLIESALSAEFGTSRGPVREALRQLENEGLVMSFPYRGAVVLGVSDEEVHEVLIPIRLTLERYSFVRAIATMTDEHFAELGKQIWLMEQAGKANDLIKLVEADLGFHEIVITASGQLHTMQIWRTIWPRIRAYFYRYERASQLRGDGGGASRAARGAPDTRPGDRGGAARAPHRRPCPGGRSGESPAHDDAALGSEPPHRLRHARGLPARGRRRRLRDRAGRHARRRRRVGVAASPSPRSR